ncbi:MAG: YlmC/YmxH family sporulation protein [Ruminococcus sp.]|nr:YlmC/YmxH family sporulation protein [Ruminococcus sp.]
MICSLEEIKKKEVIDVKTGERLGYIDDVRMDTEKSEIISVVIYGGYRFFGIFGKENDVELPCNSIKVIGSDTILADTSTAKYTKNKFCCFKSLWG